MRAAFVSGLLGAGGWQRLWRAWRVRPGRALLGLALLAVTGLSLYLPCRLLWAESHFRAAQKALDRRDFAQAEGHLHTYLDVHPNSAPAHLLLAQLARRTGFLDEAERRLTICERLDGPTPATDLEHTLLAVQQGDLSAEASLWSQVRADAPEANLILEALAQGYRKNYLLRSLGHCLDAWIKRQPDNAVALLQRAWVHDRQGNLTAAVADCRRALAADPDNRNTRVRLARALLQAGQARKAEPLFAGLYDQSPDDPQAGVGLALCRRQLGRTAQARQLLAHLTERFPETFEVLLERGRLALETGQDADAETWLRRAVALAPDDYRALYSLSQCLNRRGPPAEARALRERVRRLQADMARMSRLTDRLQRRPADPDLRRQIGDLFLRIGEDREGLFWLQSALRADPRHVPTHLALAGYYERHYQPSLAGRHRRLAREDQ
jgi:tetratricopeptide (TPR) repeat protein